MIKYVEVVIQTFLAFFAILIYTRILGKQQIGQLTYFEYITGITFGSIAGILATDVATGQSHVHFVGLTTFALLTFIMGYISLHSRPARKLIAGEATVVIQNGKVLEDNMKKMRYNLDELLMQLREKNVFNIAQVEYALLEPNGNLAVLLKSQHRPLTPNDLQIPTQYEGISTEVIQDGKVIYPNLAQLGLNIQWLQQELAKRGVTDLQQVVLASLDTQGQLYVDLRKDHQVQMTDITDRPEN